MILIRDTKNVYRSAIEAAVGKDASGKKVLDHLLGDYLSDGPDTDFVIREWSSDTRTPMQRLNMFWAIPFTLICAPYQFVAKGQVGWDTKTKIGRWVLKVTGHLEDA